MSPEQAAGRLDELGVVSDVYSLGAVLYCLLTGQAPFRDGDVITLLKRVQAGACPAPRQVKPGVPRPLEAVCQKAMALRPADRYPSAQALAADVEQWLADATVTAYGEPLAARLARWSRRHRSLVTGASALLLTTVVALSLFIVVLKIKQQETESAWRETEKARAAAVLREQEADGQRRRAESEAEKAAQVAKVLSGLFEANDPTGLNGYVFYTPMATGDRVSPGEILKRGVERVRKEFAGQPAVQAALLDTLGNTYRSLGHFREAGPLLQQALDLRRQLGANDLDLATSLHNLAWWYHDQGDYERAEPLYREALAIRKHLLGDDDLATGMSKFNLAWLLTQTHDAEEAERLFREVIELRRKHQPGERDLAVALLGFSAFLLEEGRTNDALSSILEGFAMFQQLEGMQSLGVALAKFQQALVAREAPLGLRVAERLLRETLENTRKCLGDTHPLVAFVRHELAVTLEERNQLDEAEKCYRQCLDIVRARGLMAHPKAAIPVYALAELLARRGRWPEGARLFEELIQANRERYGNDSPLLAEALHAYALSLAHRDDARAIVLRREADAIFRRHQPGRYRTFVYNLNALAAVLTRQKQPAEAERLLREALPLARERFGQGAYLVQVLDNLAHALLKQDRPAEAEPLLREALAVCREHSRVARQTRLYVLEDLGLCRMHAQDYREAEALYREALELARAEYAKDPGQLADRLDQLATALAARAAFADAAALYEEAAAARAKSGKPGAPGLVRAHVSVMLARLAAGDLEAYRSAGARLADQFVTVTDGGAARAAARVLVLRSDTTDDWARLVKRAEEMAGKVGTNRDWSVALGLLLYRAGRPQDATNRLGAAAADGDVEAAVLALARSHEPDVAAACRGLEQALAALPQDGPADDAAIAWRRRLERQVLRAECEARLRECKARLAAPG